MKNTLLVSALAVSLAGAGFLMINSNKEVRRTYEERTQLTTTKKAQSWKRAQQYQQATLANPVTGKIEIEDVLQAREQAEFMRQNRAGSVGLAWKDRGPNNVGGRTRAILVDVDTSAIVYAGSVSGGLFKSTNAGATWSPINDLSEAPAISSIAQGPNGTIYVGTGCNFEGMSGGGESSGMIGMGMYKSTDGETFTLLSTTKVGGANYWEEINAIAVDPTNDNRVFAATELGLMLSTDGGSTWTCADKNVVGNCTANYRDVKINSNGVVLGVTGATLRVSANGEVGSFASVSGTLTPSGRRTVIQFASADTAWALSVDNSGEFSGLYRSIDEGYTWDKVLSPITSVFDASVGLFNGQGHYDLALGVDPSNPSAVYIGGVQLWKYDGALSRIAAEFPSQVQGQMEYVVHSDKHTIIFDPHNPNKMFVGSDGGVTISLDKGETYWTANRGYNVTQFYGIAYDANGDMMGGSQDNGTQEVKVDPMNPGLDSGQEAEEVMGGDGYDCDYSQLTDIRFASTYDLGYGRGKAEGGFSTMCDDAAPGPVCCDDCRFYSQIRLWESKSDFTSKDSISFSNVIAPQAIQKGDGVVKSFTFTMEIVQNAAEIVKGSVSVYAGNQIVTDVTTFGTLAGNGSGSVTYTGAQKGKLTVNFTNAPSSTETVWVSFQTKYSAGSVLNLTSNTENLPINYTLPMNLNPGDGLKVQDLVQSLLVVGTTGGISITRDGLKLNEDPKWIDFSIGGYVWAFEFSPDGNHLFVGTAGGALHRLSGLNNMYTSSAGVTVTSLGTYPAGVLGIGVDPNNADNVALAIGSYGNHNHVYMSTSATTASGASSFTNVTGNLPSMPCFDIEFMADRPGYCVLGTDMGVYATDNIFAGSVSWSDENGTTMAHTPVHDVRQQTMPWEISGRHGQIYLGTHGRGMFESTTGTSIAEFGDNNGNSVEAVSELRVYPNPLSTTGTVTFELQKDGKANVQIFDIRGKLVKSIASTQYSKGMNRVQFNASEFGQGTYFVSVSAEGSRKVAKFVVM